MVEEMKTELEKEKENIKLLEQYSKKKKSESVRAFVAPVKMEKATAIKYEEL